MSTFTLKPLQSTSPVHCMPHWATSGKPSTSLPHWAVSRKPSTSITPTLSHVWKAFDVRQTHTEPRLESLRRPYHTDPRLESLRRPSHPHWATSGKPPTPVRLTTLVGSSTAHVHFLSGIVNTGLNDFGELPPGDTVCHNNKQSSMNANCRLFLGVRSKPTLWSLMFII